VLVLEDESVWFIDFETSAVPDVNKDMFQGNRVEVDTMFTRLRHRETF
jgi:hypothetical protein